MRDTLLKVTGRLDDRMGGKPVEITQAPWNERRSVYGYIERQNLPNFFRTFDFASPDASSPGRFRTSVPQQALYMMNSPFMHDLVSSIPAAPSQSSNDSAGRHASIRRLYHQFFQRPPTAEELEWGTAFLRDASPATDSAASAWSEYVQTLLMSNELVFID